MKTIETKTNMNYAVIFNYSFDDETPVYLFSTEEEAINFLIENYQEELRIDLEENEGNSIGEIQSDNRYARITTHFKDRDDITEMRVGNIYA